MDKSAENYLRFREKNDESALVDIISVHKDGLIIYINTIVGDLNIAEELAIDTFALLAVKKPNDKHISSFKTWLYTIGRNLAIDYVRKKARSTSRVTSLEDISELEGDDDIVSEYIKKERDIMLHKALGFLKPEYRQILWLVYFENMSMKEAAAIMHKSVHAAEVTASRARAALRKKLADEGFDYED